MPLVFFAAKGSGALHGTNRQSRGFICVSTMAMNRAADLGEFESGVAGGRAGSGEPKSGDDARAMFEKFCPGPLDGRFRSG